MSGENEQETAGDRTMNNQTSIVDWITDRPGLLLIIPAIGLSSSVVVGLITSDGALMNVPLVVTMLVLAMIGMLIALSRLIQDEI